MEDREGAMSLEGLLFHSSIHSTEFVVFLYSLQGFTG